MLPGARDINGFTYIITGAPPVGTEFVGGIAVSDAGQIYTASSINTNYANGFMVNNAGQLIGLAGNPIAVVKDGIGRTVAGDVVFSAAAPAATDVFVGSVRVTKDGALCVTTAIPRLLTAYSNGFNSGFS